MFTIKLYVNSTQIPGQAVKQRIVAADSFTVLRDQFGGAEITAHQGITGTRYEVGDGGAPRSPDRDAPDIYDKAIIENAAGRTTEVIAYTPTPNSGSNKVAPGLRKTYSD